MESIKSCLHIGSYKKQKPQGPLKQPSNPQAVALFEQAKGCDPAITRSVFTRVIKFALSHPSEKPTYFTKKATHLTYAITVVQGVFYVHTGKEGKPFAGGAAKQASFALKVNLALMKVGKRCELTVADTDKNIEKALAEDELAHSFDSPYLMPGSEVAFKHATESGEIELTLIQELMDKSGQAYVEDTTSSFQEREKVVSDIGQGLLYLHSHGYIHRDINPPNILVRYGSNSEAQACITDFGETAKASEIEPYTVAGKPAFLPVSLTSPDGSETIQGIKADVYSFGVTAGVILQCRATFPKMYQWVTRLLAAQPEDRPPTQEVVNDFEALRSKS